MRIGSLDLGVAPAVKVAAVKVPAVKVADVKVVPEPAAGTAVAVPVAAAAAVVPAGKPKVAAGKGAAGTAGEPAPPRGKVGRPPGGGRGDEIRAMLATGKLPTEVAAALGVTVQAVYSAAKYVPPPVATEAEIRQLLREGKSVDEVIAALDASRAAVVRVQQADPRLRPERESRWPLIKEMIEAGLSQSQAADRVGISRQAVSEMVRRHAAETGEGAKVRKCRGCGAVPEDGVKFANPSWCVKCDGDRTARTRYAGLAKTPEGRATLERQLAQHRRLVALAEAALAGTLTVGKK